MMLERVLTEERYADLTIRCVDDESSKVLGEFKVNRSFLAAASPVWHASFYGRFRESEKDAVVEYRGVAPDLFECLIRYAYFLDPKVSLSNALPVRLLSERYQVTGLKSLCDGLLAQQSLTATGVCALITSAMKYDLSSLCRSCMSNMEKHFKGKDFEQMFASPAFKRMPPAAMIELLKSDNLKVKEKNLWLYVRDWALSQVLIAEADAKGLPPPTALVTTHSKSLMPSAVASTVDTTTTTVTTETTVTTDTTATTEATAAPSTESTAADTTSIADASTASIGLEASMSKTTAAALAAAKSIGTVGDDHDEDDDDEKKVIEEVKEDRTPPTEMDFLNAVKAYIRFPLMDFEYLLTEITPTGILTVDEAYHILKGRFLVSETESPFSMRKRKAVMCFEEASVFRRGTHSSSWGYGGSNDALCLTCDRQVALVGIGLWCADGGSTMDVSIYRDNNGGGAVAIHTEASQHFDVGRNTEPQPFVFANPFVMEAGQRYCVELHQNNDGGNSSYETGSCQRSITEKGVTLSITSASNSPNGTGTSSGAFPCFYLCTDI